jgi:RNA polymerase sigma-70 factor (sigma-E family)
MARDPIQVGKPPEPGARPDSVTGTLALRETGLANTGPVPVIRDERLDADTALTALYTSHYRRLVRLAALLLDDVGTSEEVVQDAYVKMHGSWGRIRDPDAAVGYLRTTVVNLARSRLRRRMVAQKHAPKPMPDAASAEYGAMEALERDRLIEALRKLPTRQRECLVLRYYADLSEVQIAETMGISTGAVKSHASRGMASLRAMLEAAG